MAVILPSLTQSNISLSSEVAQSNTLVVRNVDGATHAPDSDFLKDTKSIDTRDFEPTRD